ncbi:MAG: hypothetical protein K9M84_04160 [Spirochaetia bacterium]|nr:hypothetical protein [Spirochaetia bacterium]MCF7940783.1 hypothetical protein [Spirochaetia bacterium]
MPGTREKMYQPHTGTGAARETGSQLTDTGSQTLYREPLKRLILVIF